MLRIYNTFNNLNELDSKIAGDIFQSLVETIDKNTLLLLSGGSTFSIYELISKQIENTPHNFNKLHISVLDERYDRSNSNFLQLKETSFYKNFSEHKVKFWGIEDFDKSPEELAEEVDSKLKGYLKNKYNILCVLGMGPDGHTSGMMPYPEDKEFFKKKFINTQNFVVAYNAGNKNEFPMRITTTMQFLLKIDKTFAYVTGQSKAKKLNEAISRKYSLNEIPFKIINNMRDVSVYTDISISNSD